MLTETLETPTDLAGKLLTHYSFDLGGCSAEVLIEEWLKTYLDRWIYLAVVEALYRGRYKALSVEQILAIWQRKGQAYFRFNHEFERLVCDNFSKVWQKLERPTVKEDSPAQKLDITKIKLLSQNNGQSPPIANQPIEQFSPYQGDTNEFYGKLKAIAKNSP
ncbi:MAG: hypothetical protein KME01_04235 [Chroococcus sp. CMT-3BRIN-NPC107]|jgi:hypothetical protein|nr:hypothetical protein [Chroococcus sp. CMT-3BRIN-NPC107]